MFLRSKKSHDAVMKVFVADIMSQLGSCTAAAAAADDDDDDDDDAVVMQEYLRMLILAMCLLKTLTTGTLPTKHLRSLIINQNCSSGTDSILPEAHL